MKEHWRYLGVTYPPHGIGYHHWMLDPATRGPHTPGYDHVFLTVAGYAAAYSNKEGMKAA